MKEQQDYDSVMEYENKQTLSIMEYHARGMNMIMEAIRKSPVATQGQEERINEKLDGAK